MIYETSTPLSFGIFKGKSLKQVVDSGPRGYDYIAWASQNVEGFQLSKDALKYCKMKGHEYALKIHKGEKIEPAGDAALDAYNRDITYECRKDDIDS